MATVNTAHKGDLYLIKMTEDITVPAAEEYVLCATSLDATFEMAAIELVPCRGDAVNSNWARAIPSTNSGTIEFEGYIIMSNDWEPKRFFDVLDTQTRVNFTIEPAAGNPVTPIVGGIRITGKAWITSLTAISAPSEEVATYSVSMTIDGRPTSTIIV